MARDYSIAVKLTAHDAASTVLRKVQDAVDNTADKARSMSSKVTSALSSPAMARRLDNWVTKAGKFIFDSVIEIEDATAKFIPKFAGDVERAKKFVEELNKTAAETPFKFVEIADVSETLMGFGVATEETVIPVMKTIGDLAGGNAQRFQSISLAYSKLMASGQVKMLEINQLITAGVPILGELAKMFGVNIGEMREMISSGKIMSSDIDRAFKRMTESGGMFHKGMEVASKTLSGRISTLEDNMKKAAATIGEVGVKSLGPLVDVLIDIANGFTSMSGTAQGALMVLGIAITGFATTTKAKMAGVALAISGVMTLLNALDEQLSEKSGSTEGVVEEKVVPLEEKFREQKAIFEARLTNLKSLTFGTREYIAALRDLKEEFPELGKGLRIDEHGISSRPYEVLALMEGQLKMQTDALTRIKNEISENIFKEASYLEKVFTPSKMGARQAAFLRISNPLYSRASGLQAAKDIAGTDIERMQLMPTMDIFKWDEIVQGSLKAIREQDKDEAYQEAYMDRMLEGIKDKFDVAFNEKGIPIQINIKVDQEGRVIGSDAQMTGAGARGARLKLNIKRSK